MQRVYDRNGRKGITLTCVDGIAFVTWPDRTHSRMYLSELRVYPMPQSLLEDEALDMKVRG